MLIFAPPAAQAALIIPFLNLCIQQKNTPMFTNMFNVWCIEKTQGIGPILHPTNKLDVRPISLFEISFKLMETVLATRINNAMTPRCSSTWTITWGDEYLQHTVQDTNGRKHVALDKAAC